MQLSRYPIIQGGMVWTSGWRLATAVSQSGALGVIGAGSMHPENFRHHVQSAKKVLVDLPFGVNLPLLYPEMDALMAIIAEEEVKIVMTSAGNPKMWTKWLKEKGCTVIHVVSSAKFALKSLEAGVDAVVAEGFEAGGHNGREETTTMVLVPMVVDAVGAEIPVIAAGGIADGRQMAAAMALGASAVQVGSRYAATHEASCHSAFKEAILQAQEGDTQLLMKQHIPVRLLKNPFQQQVIEAEKRGATANELRVLLGKGRAKKGIFEGDLMDGELEIGQVSAQIKQLLSAQEVTQMLMSTYQKTLNRISGQR